MVATIALDVANGPVGTIIEITGTDFTPAATVTFTFGGAPIVANDAPITVAGGGGFTAHITVPASLVGVKAIVADDGTVNDSEDFTVESQVVITESNITVGGTINFTGTGYGNAKAVSFTFNGVALTPVSPVTTNATGGFIGSAIVPEVPNGSRTLVATDADTNTDSDTVIVDAKIVLSPTSGIYGDTITVTGTGFGATEDIVIDIGGTPLVTDPATVTSDADGSFSGDFDIPDAPKGSNTINATDESLNTDSATLTVNPTIEIDVATGVFGDSVEVTGHGYTATDAITITFNGVDVTPGSPPTVAADGSFTGTIEVPDAPNGTNAIVATDENSGTDSINFTVDALITLTPTSGGPGDTITIAGHGFAATEDITFTIEGDALTTDPASVSSDADGAFSADFDIPLTGYDGNAVTIVATDESTNTDSAELNVIISELAINTTFSRFNGRDLHHKSVNALGSIEKSAIVDVTFSATDVYQTGGMPVQFSDVGFNQVYLCKIIHQNIGRNMSFVVGASNNPDGGKIKIWGTDGNELADESTLVQSKSIRVQIRGI